MTTALRDTAPSVRDVSVFGDAIAYFNEAADLLELDAGMRRILTIRRARLFSRSRFSAIPESSKSIRAIACSTISRAVPQKEASAIIPA